MESNFEIPQFTIEDSQKALFSMLKFGFELCLKTPKITCDRYHFAFAPEEEKRKFLEYDTKCESYRMLVFNYLIALIGNRKNDKCSIYHYPPAGKEDEIKNFLEINKELIEKIYQARNKIYSHFDVDFGKNTEIIENCEMQKIIDFIQTVLF